MKILLLIVLLPFFSFSQEMDDSGNYILKGTTVLLWSETYQKTYYQYGYFLDEIIASDCDPFGGRIEELSDEVVSAQQSDSTITVSIKKIANCSAQFLGEIEIVNDSIIRLIAHEYGGRSTCGCCFGLKYVIATEGIKPEIRYVMIGNKEETLKLITH